MLTPSRHQAEGCRWIASLSTQNKSIRHFIGRQIAVWRTGLSSAGTARTSIQGVLAAKRWCFSTVGFLRACCPHPQPQCGLYQQRKGRRTGLGAILGDLQDPSQSPPTGAMGTSLVSMTKEGFSQPGEGSHRPGQVGGPLLGLPHPSALPLVSGFNYPKPLPTA